MSDDDWEPIVQQPAAQQSAPDDDWMPVQQADRPAPTVGDAMPEAFVNRVAAGSALSRIFQAAGKGAAEGFGPQPIGTGLSDEWLNFLVDQGVFHDPAKGRPGPLQFGAEGLIMSSSQVISTLERAASAGFHGAASALGQAVEEFGGSQGNAAQAEREALSFGNWLMIEGGMGRFSRPSVVPGAVVDKTVGTLPRAQDFDAAAKVMDSPNAATNLKRMWSEDGIHPAEAVHDAQSDAFLKHQITAEPSPSGELTDEQAELLGVPKSLSAAVNTEPDPVPLADQPASPPGRLVAWGRNAADQLFGLARNVQFVLDPMATGSSRAMAIAKDAANYVRRIRWDSVRIDQDLASRFDDEQLARMWNAADEESVSLQLGEPVNMREHQGLATLEPEERAAVDDLQARSQFAWLHAVDAGMVEGEGLPAYTPRMILNVANAGDAIGPRALNELGRNVFTRTGQMLQRKYLTAEESEAAAKELVGQRMAERGASVDEIEAAQEQVKLVRNIRALPLATARLEEAAVWREMINKIEDVGKSSGSDTVAVGYKPDSSWFTIAGNPAFTRWQPLLEKNAEGKWAARLDANGEPIMAPKPIYMSPEFRGPMSAILDDSVNRGKVVQGAQSLYGLMMSIKARSMQAILNSPLIHNQVVWGKVMEAAGGREALGFRLYWRGNKIVNGATGRAQELIERGLNPIGPRASYQDISGMLERPDLEPGRSITSQVLGFVPGLFDEGAGTAVKRAIDKAGDFWHNTLLWDRVRDVQFGLADHMSDQLFAKGVDRLTADRIAGHFSNIIVGSVPKESMSAAARATANLLLFSRSFTLGNLSTYKQAAFGLPKPILAQIERDFGMSADQALGPEATQLVSNTAKGIARRKAISTVVMSTGLFYIGNALLQHAFNIAMRDSSVNDELQGYARRFHDEMKAIERDPWELRHLIAKLSPTAENEPTKQDRVYVGNTSDGTGVYVRLPFGKFGEELVGYPTKPMTMVRQKLSPMASAFLDVLENDKGFGRKIYNEHDDTIRGDLVNAAAVARHIVMKHLPEGQINAALDLLRHEPGMGVNALRLIGPALGFTASVGAPGGPQRGEQLAAKEDFEARFSIAWPDIKKQIRRGDILGARRAMSAIGVPSGMQRGLTRNALDPASALHGRTLLDFYQYATPEQKRRFERLSKHPGAPE